MTTIAQAVKQLEVEIQVKQNQLTTLLELMPKGNPGGYGKPKPSKPKPKGPKKPRKNLSTGEAYQPNNWLTSSTGSLSVEQ